MAKPIKPLTDKQIGQMIDKWIIRLRLQDWDLDIALVKPSGFTHEREGGVWGACQVQPSKKEAIIEINTDLLKQPFQFELTLVHELCHVMINTSEMGFPDLDTSGKLDLLGINYERMIDRVSKILVEAYGSKR